MLERRSFITGLISLVAAPAIVRAGSLMPVKATRPSLSLVGLAEYEGERQVEIAVLYGSLKVGDWVSFNVADFDAPIEPRQFRVTSVAGRSYELPKIGF